MYILGNKKQFYQYLLVISLCFFFSLYYFHQNCHFSTLQSHISNQTSILFSKNRLMYHNQQSFAIIMLILRKKQEKIQSFRLNFTNLYIFLFFCEGIITVLISVRAILKQIDFQTILEGNNYLLVKKCYIFFDFIKSLPEFIIYKVPQIDDIYIEIQLINMNSQLTKEQHAALKDLLNKYGVNSIQNTIKQNGVNQKMWLAFINRNISPARKIKFKKELLQIIKLKDTKRKPAPIVLVYDQIKSTKNSDKIIIQRLATTQYSQISTITDQIQNLTKQRINSSLIFSLNVLDYLKKQFNYILELLQRRSSLVKYFKILLEVIEQKKYDNPLTKLLKSMTIIDLFILIQKYIQSNDHFTFLLSKQNAPIPIAFKTKDKTVYDIKSCQSFLGLQQFFLIINIRSQSSQTPHLPEDQQIIPRNSKIFRQLLYIDEQYFAKANFQSNINLYKIHSLKNNKNVLMIDFISYKNRDLEEKMDFEDHEKIKHDLIAKLKQKTSLFIFHLSEEQMMQSYDGRLLKQFSYLLVPEVKKIVIIQQLYENNEYAVSTSAKKIFDNVFVYQYADLELASEKKNAPLDYLEAEGVFDTKVIKAQDLELGQKDLEDVQSFFARKEKIDKFIADNLDKSRNQLIPKSVKQEQLNKVRIKIKNLPTNQYDSLITQYKKQERQIQKSLQQKILSPFIDSCREFIRSSQKQFNYFIQAILKHTNANIDPLQADVVSLYQKLKDTSDKAPIYLQIENKKKEIHQKRITIDNIIHQFSIYNELIIDRSSQKPTSIEQRLINNYYQKCLNKTYPFNLLNGQNSTFGNGSLQRFFQQLNSKYLKSNIFVVSVIGAKSSGKTSLINRLFGHNFYMREDKYAKGIFMSICQIGDKVLILLDSQGVMSVDVTESNPVISSKQLGQQYATFDHQIATLIMRESNLVIFSGFNKDPKDQTISKQLQLTVGICYKVLDAIHSNNDAKRTIIPRKIIFALSNQLDKSAQRKEQMIKNLITNLRLILQPDEGVSNWPLIAKQIAQKIDELRLIFEIYIRLQANDIFLLPDAYLNKDIGIQNEDYGVSILGLRNKILDSLQKQSLLKLTIKNINQIYGDAQVYWKILLLTAKNIVEYKSIVQSYQKGQIYNTYKQKYMEIFDTIQAKFAEYFNPKGLKLQQSNSLSNYIARLQQSKNKKYTDSWSFFNDYSLSAFLTQFSGNKPDIIKAGFGIFQQAVIIISNNRLWIEQYKNRNIQRLYESILSERIHFYYGQFDKQLKQAFKSRFAARIVNLANQLTIQSRDQQQQRQGAYLEKSQKLAQEQLIFKHNPLQIQGNLVRTFKVILQSQKILLKQLQIKHIKDCLDFDNQINDQYIYNLNQFIQFQDQSQVQQKDRARIANQIKKYAQQFKAMVQEKCRQTKITSQFIKILFPVFRTQGLQNITSSLQQAITNISVDIYKDRKIKERSIQLLDTIGMDILINKQQQQNLNEGDPKLGELKREHHYLYALVSQNLNFTVERISLNAINFKVILLAKLFKILLELIKNQQIQQIKEQQLEFNNIIQEYKGNIKEIINEFDENALKKAAEDDLNAYKERLKNAYKSQFEFFWRQFAFSKSHLLYVKHLRSAINSTIDKTIIQSTTSSPEVIRKQAKDHYIQCYKFIKRPQKYILELAAQEILNSLNIQQTLAKSLNTIKNMVQNLKTLAKNQTQQTLQGFLIKNTFEQSLYVKKSIKKITFNQVKTAILSKLQNEQFLKSFFDYISNSYIYTDAQTLSRNVVVIDMKDYIVGCKQCCPMCGSKCLKQSNHEGQHQSLSHRILAFGGCIQEKSGQFLIHNCLTLNITQKTWFLDRTNGYPNALAMIRDRFFSWANDLPLMDKLNTFNHKDVPLNLKLIWANIEDAMRDAYKQAFNQRVIQSSDQQIKAEKQNQNYLRPQDLTIQTKSIITGTMEMLNKY